MDNQWINTDEKMPDPYTDVWIKLVSGFESGLAGWDPKRFLWCGYSGNYTSAEVEFWRARYASDTD